MTFRSTPSTQVPKTYMSTMLTSPVTIQPRPHAPLAAVVVDEVFADFELRVDAPAENAPATSFAAETEQLVATIGRQLKSIEAQKNRLVRLLGDMGIAANF